VEIGNLDNLQRQQIIEQARSYWDKGEPLKTGLIIFERIPLAYRPVWAADILESVYLHFTSMPEMTAALDFARQPDQWPSSRYTEAKQIFVALSWQQSQLPDFYSVESQILELAKHMVGVTYTARQYLAPFDHHRGWSIVESLYSFVNELSLNEGDAWSIIANEEYILLDAPISCNPGCPICHPPRWSYNNILNDSG
jgi:hypothetical protein